MKLPNIDDKIHIAFLDTLSDFSKFNFKPNFLKEKTIYKGNDGRLFSINMDLLNNDIQFWIESESSHYKMLKEIKTDWSLRFSNFSWNSEDPNSGNWNRMNSIIAKEWVVIATNIGYMLSSDEYRKVIDKFAEIFGADLFGNNKIPFTEEEYNSLINMCFNKKSVNLGRTRNVGGLGGGSTWGVSDWNFYGHYASYSGWESITHELGHCYGFGHDSNMTYPNPAGVSWAECISQLHVYMMKNNRLPYENRNILGTHRKELDEFRDFTCSSSFMNDAKTETFYNNSKVTKYFISK